MSRVFLVRLHRDPVIQRIVWRPIEMWFSDEVVTIPKDVIVCDACGERVATSEDEVEAGVQEGFAVVEVGDGESWMLEVVCDGCRRKYFSRCEVFDEMSDGLGGD